MKTHWKLLALIAVTAPLVWLTVNRSDVSATSRLPAADSKQGPLISLGVARVDITPDGPIQLIGYGNRKTESTGVASKIWAKAIAIGSDTQGPSVLVTVELIGAPATVVEPLAARLKKKIGLDRSRLAVCATHTHTGPALADLLIEAHFGRTLPAGHKARIVRYTAQLIDKLEQVVLKAVAARKPARLAVTQGKVTFAVNRRQIRNGKWVGMRPNYQGAVDHALPVLTATDADGKLRAVLLSYACHCTTYGGKFNKIHGDWAGAAAQMIEQRHPGSVALIAIGCGGDANPQPRGASSGSAWVNRHGKSVADEVDRLLSGHMKPLTSVPKCRLKRIDLPLDHVPTRAELLKRSRQSRRRGFYARILLDRLDRGEKLIASFPYPVQTWTFGKDLAMVFLAGEVVADYSLRLKRELGADRLWVNAYSNDATCYVASRRMIPEGGYEVDQSMDNYNKPTRLALDAEDRIVNAVRELMPPHFRTGGTDLTR